MQYNNSLTRSSSKSKVWKHCQRKYFFSYYTNSLKEIDQSVWLKTLLLKNLKSMNMWLGGVIHVWMSRYLTGLYDGKNDLVSKLNQDLLEEMDKVFFKSKNKNYSVYDSKDKFGLSEHFYGEDIDEIYKNKKEFVMSVFSRFINSDLHQGILDHIKSENTLFIEPDEPDFESMRFDVDLEDERLKKFSVMAQPDFGVVLSPNEYIIYDWKNGENRNSDSDIISDQLKTYAYKVAYKKGLKDFSIKAYEVYLKDMSIVGGDVSKRNLDEIQDRIIDDILEIKEKLIDKNVISNKPISIDVFEKTKDSSKCLSCRFREVCNSF